MTEAYPFSPEALAQIEAARSGPISMPPSLYSQPGTLSPMDPLYEYAKTAPVLALTGNEEHESLNFQALPGTNYRLVVGGQVVGSASSPEEVAQLVAQANQFSEAGGAKADVKVEKQLPYSLAGETDQRFVPVYENNPNGNGLLGTLIPAALAAMSGGVLGPILGPAFGVSGAVGTGLASGLGSVAGSLATGSPLGDALKKGAITGITAGGLSGLGAFGDAGGSSLTDQISSTLAENVAQMGGQGLGSALGGSIGSGLGAGVSGLADEAIINVLANTLGSGAGAGLGSAAGSALGSIAGSGGSYQPQPGDSPIINVSAPRVSNGALGLAGGIGGAGALAGIGSSLVSVPPAQQALAAQQGGQTQNDEIIVTAPAAGGGAPLSALGLGGLGLAGIGSSLVSVPPAPPPKTPLQKALTTGGRVLTGLSLLGGLAGGGGRPASGMGASGAGTRASLDPVFGGQLPPARGTFAPGARAPRDMGDIDYERYGYGPARSFFENVPETPEQYRAALAANAPRPMVAGAGTVGVPNFTSNLFPSATGSAALQAVRRLAPGVSDAQIEAFLATPEGADFLAALQEAETPQGAARGGAMAVKGRGKPSRDSYAVNGVGDGRSDEIPALLSDGEYVIDAETVALLGNGSGKAGAKQLDDLRVKIRKHKGRNLAKGRFSDNAKAPEKYLSGGRT